MKFKIKKVENALELDSYGSKVNINGDLVLTLNNIYPIGAVYISTIDVSPASFLINTSWERLPEGYTLWTINSGEGGTTISAGLPNISGGFNSAVYTSSSVSGWGAFGAAANDNSAGRSAQNGSYYFRDGAYSFNASNSNSIYGKSSTVQPPAIKVFIWKRVS